MSDSKQGRKAAGDGTAAHRDDTAGSQPDPAASSSSSQTREALPVEAVLGEVIDALRVHGRAILRAPTGAGKTTRVPPALLDAGLAGDGAVMVLEPRRVAARAAARRMAAERGGRVGEEVGYHVRLDRQAGPHTRILAVTEGILLQRLQRDPFLDGVGLLIFDEFHERGLTADLALALARQVQREARDDLGILVTSATLELGGLARFLGDCPVIESQGRRFPVEISYLDRPDDRPLPARVAAGIRRALTATDGDLLAFLPGLGEIRRTASALEDLEATVDLVPLYGDLPPERQDAALGAGSRRRVVLATNVAETSVTVQGVTGVVDGGLVREMRFDPGSGLDRLELVPISRASADQRAGRAGRLGPGRCWRLWTAAEDSVRPDHTRPEVARVDLAGAALQLFAWGETDLESFGWFEAPDAARLARARQLLTRLGAVDGRGLTALGRRMASLPVQPRVARLLLAAAEAGVPGRGALAAVLLTERPPFRRPGPDDPPPPPSPSDLLDQIEALEAFAAGRSTEGSPWGRRLLPGRARTVARLAEPFRRALRGDGKRPARKTKDAEPLLRALLAAFPDRLARRREAGSDRGILLGGRGVRLDPASAVRDGELFLCLEIDGGGPGGEARVRLASAIDEAWLPEGRITESRELRFDESRETVVQVRQRRFDDLVLGSRETPPDDAAAAAQTLIRAAAERLGRALDLNAPELMAFRLRLSCLAAWRPELAAPEVDDEALRDLLPVLAAGKRSFKELRRQPLLDILRGSLSHEQRSALERIVPERIEVPSGSRIRLQYRPSGLAEGPAEEPPILAVRIQELFGLDATPTVDDGRRPVLLHLLAPNGRPQQITQDLPSFWRRTYPEVRKELLGRYPKHAWPTDPLAARAERRPGRRRR